MANNEKKIGFLSEGSTVEVRMEGAWYEAGVVAQCAKSNDQFRLLCRNRSTNYKEKLMDFHTSSIRPRPPPADQRYEPHDVVDVLDGDGWWEGVVSGVYTLKGKTSYTVALFEIPPSFKDKIFTSKELSFHWVWTDDAKWVRPPKSKEIPGVGEESSTLEQLEPLTANTKKGFLSEGSTVEVRMGGAWFEAGIVTQCPKSKDQFRVLSIDTELWWRKKLMNFHTSSIRPLPPPPVADESYEPREVVDVLGRNGWWKGVVSGVYVFKGKPRYTVVLFESPPYFEDTVFTSQELRFHWVWTVDGKWVRPPNPKEIPGLEEESSTLEKSNPVTDTSTGQNLNTSEPETVKFRKENPVVSSAREESQSASMGKNPSLNEQEAGLKTRLAKSSKKRPRESNGHITNQQVLAADNTNDASTEGIKKGNFDRSSEVNAQERSEIARKEDLPFRKSSYLWKEIDSLEVFRMLPQSSHFSPLIDCNEDTNEGMVMGHMWNFASLVEKVSKLQIEDPESLFQRYLEALAVLETVGFDVKAVVDRINELLAFKTKQEQLAVELSSLKDMFKVKAGAPW